MPSNDNIQLPTLEIPIEVNMESGRKSLKELEKEFKQSGDRAGQAMGEAGGETKKFTDKLKDAAAAAGGLALIAGRRLAAGLKGLGRVVGGVTSFFVDLTALGILGVSRGLHRLDAELEDNGRAWKTVGDVAGGTASVLDKVAGTLIRVTALLNGFSLAVGAITGGVMIMANRASAEFTASFNRVITLLPKGVTGIAELRAEVNAMTGDLGATADEANGTFYQVLSAMPELVDEPTRALGLLRVALEAGTTGFADSSEAAAATTAVLNAFNMEAEQAREVADALFATQNQGVTTFGEVAGSIGRVANLASSLGAEYEDLLGIVATLTPKGQDTAEVFTQIRAALNNILRPSTDAQRAARELGIEFDATAVRTKGLKRFLVDLIEVTEGNPEVLARFFGSTEALNLIVSLSSATDELQQKTHAIANSAGSTSRAVEQMNTGWERQKEILGGQLKAELRAIGIYIESVGTGALRLTNLLVGLFRVIAHGPGEDWEGPFPALNERIGEALERRRLERAREGVNIMERHLELQTLFRRQISESAAAGLSELVSTLEEEAELFEAGTPAHQAFVDLLQQARERLDYVNQGLERHAEVAGEAAEADGELVQRQRELERLIFGERGTRPADTRDTPIPRPAEPTSAAYVRQKVENARALAELRAIRGLAETGDMEAYETAVRDSQEAVNALVIAEMERLEAAGASEQQLAEVADLYRILSEETDRAAQAQAQLRAELEDRVFRLTADAVDLQARSVEQLADRIREEFGEIPAWAAEQLEQLRQNVERSRVLTTFQDQFRELQRGPATPESADAMAEIYHSLRAEADQLPENLQLREDYLELLEKIADAIDRIRQSRKQEADTEEDALDSAVRDARALAREIEQAGRAGVQLANALGLVDSEAARALENIVQIAAAVTEISKMAEAGAGLGAMLGPIAAVAGGIAGIAGQVFGTSPEEQRAREAMEENTRALDRLYRGVQELGAVLSGGATGSDIAGLTEAARTAAGSAPWHWDVFQSELQRLGLTLDEAREVARGFGIELDGTQSSIQAFLEALQQFQLDQLFTTYAGQLEMLRQEFELFDIEDPIEQLRRMLEVFGEFSDIDIPGFDLSTEEGRQAAEAWIQEMFRRLQSGELTPEQLGGMTVDQFRQFLSDFESTLDQAGGGVVGGTAETRLGVSITEVQASQMLSQDLTRNRFLEQIRDLLGGGLPTTTPIPSRASLGLTRVDQSVRIGHMDFDIDIPINTTGGVSRRELEEGGRAAGEAMSRELAKRLGGQHRADGKLGAPKFVIEGKTR